MLDYLALKDTGPAPSLTLDLAPRLNLLIGDNSLGKTFVLDVAWWALTNTWIGEPAAPSHRKMARPEINRRLRVKGQSHDIPSTFDFAAQEWSTIHKSEEEAQRPHLVLYAQVDGSFAVWDPLRTAGKYRRPFDEPTWGLSSAFHFAPQAVWRGLEAEDRDKTVLCNGMIRDWALWQLQDGPAYSAFIQCLTGLLPNPDIRPGRSTTRVSVHDVRDIPTLMMPYGEIPITYASAGMKRILSLAYLLVWLWREHQEAARLKNTEPSDTLVLLLDEAEAHLFPRWQRLIVPALLRVIQQLAPTLAVQMVVSTHAPLVLASIEPLFDDDQDAFFKFRLDPQGGQVKLTRDDWHARGDANSWLTSVFDLGEARSVEAEAAIQDAQRALRNPDAPLEELRLIHEALHRVLKETDPFWVRWLYRAERAGLMP